MIEFKIFNTKIHKVNASSYNLVINLLIEIKFCEFLYVLFFSCSIALYIFRFFHFGVILIVWNILTEVKEINALFELADRVAKNEGKMDSKT